MAAVITHGYDTWGVILNSLGARCQVAVPWTHIGVALPWSCVLHVHSTKWASFLSTFSGLCPLLFIITIIITVIFAFPYVTSQQAFLGLKRRRNETSLNSNMELSCICKKKIFSHLDEISIHLNTNELPENNLPTQFCVPRTRLRLCRHVTWLTHDFISGDAHAWAQCDAERGREVWVKKKLLQNWGNWGHIQI